MFHVEPTESDQSNQTNRTEQPSDLTEPKWVVFRPLWTPAKLFQAEDRQHRIGSPAACCTTPPVRQRTLSHSVSFSLRYQQLTRSGSMSRAPTGFNACPWQG